MISTISIKKINGRLLFFWENHPLTMIMAVAILFRFLAAIFAKGWGMLDDHYLVIEASQSWVYGYDYNFWLPSSRNNTGPTGHNFFYPGLHYLLFSLMKLIHLQDPMAKMLIIRFLHGSFSLITVYFGYRIVEKLEDKKSARLAGILLAITYFMPWTSVRNLAESTCIPFLMLGFWHIIKPVKGDNPFPACVLAGIFFGLAADIRYQSLFFPAGVGVLFLFQGKWRELAGIVVGVAVSFLAIQILIDLFIWGYPLAEFIGYISVNVADRNSYFNQPWYNYFLTVGGVMLPPVSLLLFYGFFRGWRRYLLIFFPAALFFAFHSFFPNKQERFILPFIPFFIMTGAMGYFRYIAGTTFGLHRKTLLKGAWIFFWTANIILLAGLTFMYSKRAQVESMYYLFKYPYVKTIIMEDENGGVPMAPLFYTGKWPEYPEIPSHDTSVYQQLTSISAGPRLYHPQFFLFTGSKNLSQRVSQARMSFPLLAYETTIEPGFVDKVMHWLNPVNKANKVYIYRNREFYKSKKDK